jgi:hypothetical protein
MRLNLKAVFAHRSDARHVRGSSRDPPGEDGRAYRYGLDMRSNDKYRNRSWNEAEPGLRSGWEALAPDDPAWDASRPAVHRGWDKVTPEIDDDSYYRNHWTTSHASGNGDDTYGDREPGHLHGSEARRSERYRSRDWRDVEPRLTSDRAMRHAGRLSSWDTFKYAVRHGWHGIGPDMDGMAAAQPGQDASLVRGTGSASPSWDKVKAAVRHGWARIIPGAA